MALFVDGPNLTIGVEPLSQETFKHFGTVTESPQSPLTQRKETVSNGVSANQGTAIKYTNVTNLESAYDSCPSKTPAEPVVNMFACSPRLLRRRGQDSPRSEPVSVARVFNKHLQTRPSQQFDVWILERHPFTSQTFVPMGLDADDVDTCFLVIVAPTLKSDSTTSSDRRGPPDLHGLRAFLARGNQAVTYAAGTWHAPMVVLGAKAVDFVVLQYSNGVALEDCEEVNIEVEGRGGPTVSLHPASTRFSDSSEDVAKTREAGQTRSTKL